MRQTGSSYHRGSASRSSGSNQPWNERSTSLRATSRTKTTNHASTVPRPVQTRSLKSEHGCFDITAVLLPKGSQGGWGAPANRGSASTAPNSSSWNNNIHQQNHHHHHQNSVVATAVTDPSMSLPLPSSTSSPPSSPPSPPLSSREVKQSTTTREEREKNQEPSPVHIDVDQRKDNTTISSSGGETTSSLVHHSTVTATAGATAARTATTVTTMLVTSSDRKSTRMIRAWQDTNCTEESPTKHQQTTAFSSVLPQEEFPSLEAVESCIQASQPEQLHMQNDDDVVVLTSNKQSPSTATALSTATAPSMVDHCNDRKSPVPKENVNDPCNTCSVISRSSSAESNASEVVLNSTTTSPTGTAFNTVVPLGDSTKSLVADSNSSGNRNGSLNQTEVTVKEPSSNASNLKFASASLSSSADVRAAPTAAASTTTTTTTTTATPVVCHVFQTPLPDASCSQAENERRRQALAMEQQTLILRQVQAARAVNRVTVPLQTAVHVQLHHPSSLSTSSATSPAPPPSSSSSSHRRQNRNQHEAIQPQMDLDEMITPSSLPVVNHHMKTKKEQQLSKSRDSVKAQSFKTKRHEMNDKKGSLHSHNKADENVHASQHHHYHHHDQDIKNRTGGVNWNTAVRRRPARTKGRLYKQLEDGTLIEVNNQGEEIENTRLVQPEVVQNTMMTLAVAPVVIESSTPILVKRKSDRIDVNVNTMAAAAAPVESSTPLVEKKLDRVDVDVDQRNANRNRRTGLNGKNPRHDNAKRRSKERISSRIVSAKKSKQSAGENVSRGVRSHASSTAKPSGTQREDRTQQAVKSNTTKRSNGKVVASEANTIPSGDANANTTPAKVTPTTATTSATTTQSQIAIKSAASNRFSCLMDDSFEDETSGSDSLHNDQRENDLSHGMIDRHGKDENGQSRPRNAKQKRSSKNIDAANSKARRDTIPRTSRGGKLFTRNQKVAAVEAS